MKFRNCRIVGFAVFGMMWSGLPAHADHAHHSPANVVVGALTGAMVEGEDQSGNTYRITYGADGVATLSRGEIAETGSWSVDKGGHYCEIWPKTFGGVKRCTGVEVIDQLIVLRGKIATTRSIRPK